MKRLETKAERLAARWIPKDYQPDSRNTDTAAVYLGQNSAMGFIGTASKHAFYFSFKTELQRETYVAQWFADQAARMQVMAERAAKRKAFQHSLKVGDVLVNSWGYDQTNVDFFEVTKVTPGSNRIEIREIGQDSQGDGFMTGSCTASRGKYIGEPLVKVVGEGNSVKIHDWGSWARPWDGRKERWSSYA